MRLGIAHHLGWAVAVIASADHEVADRRRIELIEPGLPAAPVEHEAGLLSDAAAAALVARVRASALRATAASLGSLGSGAGSVGSVAGSLGSGAGSLGSGAGSLGSPIRSISLRAWPLDFPDDIAVQRRPPYASRADSVMYCQVLAECAEQLGWRVHLYDAKEVEVRAGRILAGRADEVLHGPRARLGPPWTRDHRIALAATVLASAPTTA